MRFSFPEWLFLESGGGTLSETLTGVSEIAASAEEYTYGDLTYVYLDDGTIEITGCDTSVIEVEIPSEIDGVAVTSVGDETFTWCESLVNIAVNENNAYYSSVDGVLFDKEQTTLVSYPVGREGEYIIPNGVANIEKMAFSFCSCLTGITIPESVINIGDYAFYYCINLTSIVIEENVENIGESAFSGCENLTNIAVNENNVYYSSVDGVLFDKEQAVLICYPVGKEDISYVIPNSVTSIGMYAFFVCYSLTSITIPDGVVSIKDSAFGGCENLVSVNIPSSVTSIENHAFYGCISLIDITIPDSVTSIEESTFESCVSLTNVTIPDGITSIGEYAFSLCTSLTDVYYTGSEEDWNAIEISDGNECLADATVHFSDGTSSDSTTTETEDTTTGTNTTTTTPAKPADLDADDAITISDAFLCLTAYANSAAGNDDGLTDAQREAADVDGDGSITIMDASYILQFYAQTAAGNNPTWEDIISA